MMILTVMIPNKSTNTLYDDVESMFPVEALGS